MKYLVIILMALLVVTAGNAQTHSKPFGSKGITVVTVNDTLEVDTITITPRYTSQAYTVAADTVNLVFVADTSRAFTGNRLLFKIDGGTETRYVTFSTKLEAPADSVQTNKMRLWEFVYIYDRFVLLTRGTEY